MSALISQISHAAACCLPEFPSVFEVLTGIPFGLFLRYFGHGRLA